MERRRFVQGAFVSSLAFAVKPLQGRGESTKAQAIAPPDRMFMATLPRLMELE